jgi:enamine deaminase RidA (YjgF/YER057c/UK114 family)
MKGGLLQVSEIMSPIAAKSRDGTPEGDLAVEEALAVLELLRLALTRHGATAQDVIFVHLYLSEISHFGLINSNYRNFFGTLLPPSRSCVDRQKCSSRWTWRYAGLHGAMWQRAVHEDNKDRRSVCQGSPS